VAAGAIDGIPVRGKPAVYILQAARQSVFLVWDSNEMNVIGHQAIADQFYSVSLDALLRWDTRKSTWFSLRRPNSAPPRGTLRKLLTLSLAGQRFILTGAAGLALDTKTGQECVSGRPDEVPRFGISDLLGRL
jgi:hypothetical protein